MPTSDSFCAGLHQPFSRYPADKRFPAGKLGLLCECAPLAFLVEQAGGMATNGYERILDISPEVGLPQTPSCAARACDEIYQKSERALRVNRVCACVRVCVCEMCESIGVSRTIVRTPPSADHFGNTSHLFGLPTGRVASRVVLLLSKVVGGRSGSRSCSRRVTSQEVAILECSSAHPPV
jgi:hypothetical protein